MIAPINFKSLYDFSQVEKAVQSYFCDADSSGETFVKPPSETDATREAWTPEPGMVAFFTAYEGSVFQATRPRVVAFLSAINPSQVPQYGVVDGNGAIRNYLWNASLLLEIITQPNYTYHVDLRAATAALGEMIAPMVADQTQRLGANAFSSIYQIVKCVPQNHDTSIHMEQGWYGSQLNYQITFGVPKSAIQAVA